MRALFLDVFPGLFHSPNVLQAIVEMEGLEALVNLEKLWICEVGSREICHITSRPCRRGVTDAHPLIDHLVGFGNVLLREVVCLSSVKYIASSLHFPSFMFAWSLLQTDGSTPQIRM